MPKINKDIVMLIAGHAIILGHKPEKLIASQLAAKLAEHPQDIEQFGLFDNSTPNYTTYYPEVTEKDLHPSEDEFIEPMFRMLSNVTVHAKFNPINFPKEVLKSSMKLLVGQTINIDHEWAVGNAVGSVKAVEWQDSYKAGNITIPAGINAVLKIDGKSNPRIVRGIMMDPPSIHSNSVTVSFEWVKSHPEMDDESFWSKLGTYDKKGNLIQRVATKILAYHETSLVGHGADPFAQKIKDGKIVNPKYAKARYPLSSHLKNEAEQFIVWDWKQFNGKDIISNDTTILEEFNNEQFNNEKNQKDMEVILRMLETIWGLEINSLTEENYEEKLKGIKIESDQFKSKAEEDPAPLKIGDFEGSEAIKIEMTRLGEIVKDLPEDLTAQLIMAKTGTEMIQALRDDTDRLYKLTVEEGKEDASILAVHAGADYATLKALHKQYDELTEGEFNFTCKECGSHDITRASASPANGDEGLVIKSTEEVIQNLTSPNKAKMTIFKS